MTVFLLILAFIAAALAYRSWAKKSARAALLASPLAQQQREMVARQVPLTQRLPADLHSKLEGKVNLFLDQVDFIGCNGLEVTDEMRFSIAAQACLLVVNTDQWYDNLTTILVYPNAFKSRQRKQDGYVVTERETVRTGESWARGPVVLSWAHSRRGALDDTDGHNVVFHEFAHQLDDLSGHTDGVPPLGKGQSFVEWERAFLDAFENHARNVEHGHKTVIDAYGAEGHEEFFAVAVELFFERPKALKREAPQIYAQLVRFFRLEPQSWRQHDSGSH